MPDPVWSVRIDKDGKPLLLADGHEVGRLIAHGLAELIADRLNIHGEIVAALEYAKTSLAQSASGKVSPIVIRDVLEHLREALANCKEGDRGNAA